MSNDWKLALTAGLMVAIVCSVGLRAPRHSIDRVELRRLVIAALALYGVGALASLAHHGALAGVVYASGILVCSLAVWLSRGSDRGDGPDWPGGGDSPEDEQPPPGPDGIPTLDWDEFERERARWERDPATR